jgi:hypothetical protein
MDLLWWDAQIGPVPVVLCADALFSWCRAKARQVEVEKRLEAVSTELVQVTVLGGRSVWCWYVFQNAREVPELAEGFEPGNSLS